MAELINIITVKPNWEEKINDSSIVTKWKQELKKQSANEVYLDLVIDLLKDYQKTKSKKHNEYVFFRFGNRSTQGLSKNQIKKTQ
jgi:hypothetical protein